MKLTDKDIEDGKEILKLFSEIPEKEKLMAVVYIRALKDAKIAGIAEITGGIHDCEIFNKDIIT